jgi:DNA polymerase-3 subunit epsilon
LILDRPLAVIDVESTGVDVATDRVVEVAVLRVEPDGRRSLFHRRVRPGVPLPPAAVRVHGITDADVAACPPFAAVAAEVLDALAGADLAGFGLARFDLPLLAAEFGRAGHAFPLAGRAVVDALTVFRRMEPRDLSAAVRVYLGRDHEGAHSAPADAAAALAVLDAQVGRYGLPATPAGLHDLLIEVDVAGRFRRDADGHVAFAFGKHAGRRLADVARADPSYLVWVLNTVPLLADARGLIEAALAPRPTPTPLRGLR